MADNQRKADKQQEIERKQLQKEQAEAAMVASEQFKRLKALQEAESAARNVAENVLAEKTGEVVNDISDQSLLEQCDLVSLPSNSIPEAVQAGLKAHKVTMEHLEWMRERKSCIQSAPSSETFQLQFRANVPPELDLIFGSGVNRLAIEYHEVGVEYSENVSLLDDQESLSSSENKHFIKKTDYKESGLKGRKRNKGSKISGVGDCFSTSISSSMGVQRSDSSGSESSTVNQVESKKLRLEEETLWDEAVLGSKPLVPKVSSEEVTFHMNVDVPGTNDNSVEDKMREEALLPVPDPVVHVSEVNEELNSKNSSGSSKEAASVQKRNF